MASIAISGVSKLREGQPDFVRSVVGYYLSRGDVVFVGCCTGVDEAAVSLAENSPYQYRILAQFDKSGAGWWSEVSNRNGVLAAAKAGANVKFLAGGDLSVKIGIRLANRSLAMVRSLAKSEKPGVVAFPACAPSKPFANRDFPSCGSGTWATVGACVKLGIPALVIPLPGTSFDLPKLPAVGDWVEFSNGVFCGYRWQF